MFLRVLSSLFALPFQQMSGTVHSLQMRTLQLRNVKSPLRVDSELWDPAQGSTASQGEHLPSSQPFNG